MLWVRIHFRLVGVGWVRRWKLEVGLPVQRAASHPAPLSIADCSVEVIQWVVSASQRPCEVGRAQIIIERNAFSSSSSDIGQVFTPNCVVPLFYTRVIFQTLKDHFADKFKRKPRT